MFASMDLENWSYILEKCEDFGYSKSQGFPYIMCYDFCHWSKSVKVTTMVKCKVAGDVGQVPTLTHMN
jgi:hypothetical protein